MARTQQFSVLLVLWMNVQQPEAFQHHQNYHHQHHQQLRRRLSQQRLRSSSSPSSSWSAVKETSCRRHNDGIDRSFLHAGVSTDDADDEQRRKILLASLMVISSGALLSSSSAASAATTAGEGDATTATTSTPKTIDTSSNHEHLHHPKTLSETASIIPSPSLSLETTNNLLLSDATAIVTAATGSANTVDWKSIFEKAGKRALGSGKAGAAASIVQVLSLMWLRTSMNYQYRYGGDLQSSLRTLWNDGGIPRLYQGLPFALVQGPLTRFGDTAANVGILALLDTIPETRDLPLPIKTACGSVSAGLWRILLMPLDASKTSLQVEGQEGLSKLWNLVKEEGPAPLYYGALAQASATAAGHWPWFLTFNYVDKLLPEVSSDDDLFLSLVRSAFLGLSASCVSDVISNSLRVIKTTKQTARLGGKGSEVEGDVPSYPEIVASIIEKDGINGLLFRGLQTRLLTNSIQSALFSVVWKYLQQTQVLS